jgi:hypothetical protein
MSGTNNPNPFPITVTNNPQVLVVCNVNASFNQRVTLFFDPGMEQIVGQFTGVGENTTMDPATGLRFAMQGTTLWALFEFEQDGTFQRSTNVSDPVTRTFMTTISSEDSQDGDSNDSFLIVIVTSP